MLTALAIAGLALPATAAAGLGWLHHRLANVADGANLEAAVDREARKCLDQGLAPALAAGVYRDGRSLIRGHGTLSPRADAPPDGDTLFQIASVSKLFTASLLQALCDQRVVTLDATLGALIGHRWALAPKVSGITLRQLATHTSGLPGIPRPLQAQAQARAGSTAALADPYAHLEPEAVFGYLATAPDQKAPGRFDYSNFGMGLLGHVLEAVTGQDYEDLVVRHVLQPLDMASTRITLPPALAARLAPGHDDRRRPAGLWHFKSLAGAGAFSSCVRDLLAFIRGCVEPGTPAARAFQAMHAPQSGGHTGLGWMQPGRINRFIGNRRTVWHNGRVGGYAACLAIDPGTRTGAVLLANRSADVTVPGLMLARLARTQSWSRPAP